LLSLKHKSVSRIAMFLVAMCFALGSAGHARSPERPGELSPMAPLLVDFSQGSNRNPHQGEVVWIRGILRQNNSLYIEGMSTLQRIIFFNIPKTIDDVHTLTLSHQANELTSHAYDFITSWPQAVKAGMAIGGLPLFANLNECGPQIGPPESLADVCVILHGSGFTITTDVPDTMGPLLGDEVASKAAAYESYFGNRTVKIYGDSPISAASMSFDGYRGNADMYAQYTLTWTSRSSSILIEMAGHLAVTVDPLQAGIGYGDGRGSANFYGGPYRFRLHQLDGASLGVQENQILGADIFLPPSVCEVSPESEGVCAGESATFTAHSRGGTRPFTWEWTKPPDTAVLSTDSALTISNATAADGGQYQVVVVDQNCFREACYAYLTVLPQPECGIVDGADSLCFGDTTRWCATPDGMMSYEWNVPPSGSTFTERCLQVGAGLAPGTYTYRVKVTNDRGCAEICARELTVLPKPACGVDAWMDSLCFGDTTTWCAEPDGMESYEWSEPAGGFTCTEQCPLLGEGLAPGTYTYQVVVCDQQGCIDTCYRDLTVLPPPGCDIVNESDSLCFGDTTTWCAEPDGMESYEWSEPVSGFTSLEQCPLLGEGLSPGRHAFTVITTDFYGCADTCSRDLMVWVPVPVVMASFEATAGGDFIAIDWITASEMNCQRWEIYRGDGRDGGYRKIGELPGYGSTETAHAYRWVDRVVNSEFTYFYKIKQVDFDGKSWWSHAVSAIPGSPVPKSYALSQNYPNPFNAETEIRYQIPEDDHVVLVIYNTLGEEVRTLVDMDQAASWYVVTWDGRDDLGLRVASGLYFCRLKAGDFSKTIKMIFVK
jgi:hypothetical protein